MSRIRNLIIRKKLNSDLIHHITTHSKILKQFWKNYIIYYRQTKSIGKCFLIFWFFNEKSLKDSLIRASTPIIKSIYGSKSCRKRNCWVYHCFVKTDTFGPITTDGTFTINEGSLNCSSKKVVYLLTCKKK